MKTKLSDYIFERISELGVKDVFLVPGGAAMHLNDSLAKHPQLDFICNLHEQASAIAAEGYARVTNNLGVAMVTAGPGGTNAITGVAGAWLDSTPCLFLSGQVKTADLTGDKKVRQLGVQEIDIVSLVSSITKYAVTITEADTIRFHFEKAIHLAKTGRSGPVWLDIPLDVQAAMVDHDLMSPFVAEPLEKLVEDEKLMSQVCQVIDLLNHSERPVILVGNGVRLAGAVEDFRMVAEIIGAPVLSTILGMDLIGDNHPLYAGRPGANASRCANFTLQNADLLIVIGSRLDMGTTGYDHKRLARGARKIMVDIDPWEIRKMNTPIELPIVADARQFIQLLIEAQNKILSADRSPWLDRVHGWKKTYPVVQPEYRAITDCVSTYIFSDVLSEELSSDELIVPTSSGLCCEIFYLAFRVKQGQRIYHNRGTGSMGFAVPSSIGACVAAGRKRTICIEGDGGLQMNIQELQTIVTENLPIKLFILNNNGYASIRISQKKYFNRLIAADPSSKLKLPDMEKIAAAYGISYLRIENHDQLQGKIRHCLDMPGPTICEVIVQPDEVRAPGISSRQMPDGSMVSTPLEDLWPFLDREEFRRNMIVPPVES